jgi:hypothetical protein
MSSLPRTRIVLGFNRSSYPLLLAQAQAVHDGIAGDVATFPSPQPTMALFATQIQDLRTKQQATVGRPPGAATARNASALVVISSLEGLETYVQLLCDKAPEQAGVIAAAARMKIAADPVVHKPELAAKNGPVSGSALLAAHRALLMGGAGKRGFFNWQYSLDGKTWVSVPPTMLAKTQIDGLPPLTTVAFRVSTTPSRGASTPWSQAVTLLIR